MNTFTPLVTARCTGKGVLNQGESAKRISPTSAPNSAPSAVTRQFEGNSTAGVFTVDFRAVRELIDQVEAETGSQPAEYTLSVRPHITVVGNVGSHAVDESYTPAFDVQYTRTRITPPTELGLSENVSIGEDVIMANQLGVLGIEQSVVAWRWTSVGAAVLGLGTAATIAMVGFPGLGRPEAERVHARYGSMLVPVETNGSTPSATSIHVGSMSYLARLAQRDGGIIFHESSPAVHRYFVRDGQDTYDYMVPVSRNGASAHADAAESTEN